MIKTIFSLRPLDTDLLILSLRLVFGGMFIYFGYGKLVSYNEMLPMFGEVIGLGAKPELMLVIFAEFFCGIFVAIGLLTRLSVIPIFITMIVAYFISHAADPFTMKHAAFVYMLLSVVVFVAGSGKYSVDALLFRNRLN